MAIDVLQTVDIIEVMENYIDRIRPDDEMRKMLDFGYRIENQSIILFEIRPKWNDPNVTCEHPFAKTTYVKKNNHWKVFWLRADLKWHAYPPHATVATLQEFIRIVEEDKHHCFFG